MATVASLFRDAVQVTPAAEQVDALPAASMVALPDELLRHIFRQACSVLEPRCAVALSSASHGLWALTQEGRQQLKADHEAATAAAEVNCTICNQRWPSLLMLQHMGYHQLHTPEKMVSTNSCSFCGGDARKNAFGTEVPAVHRLVNLFDRAVEAHGDSGKSRVLECLRLIPKEIPVCCQGDIFDTVQRNEVLY